MKPIPYARQDVSAEDVRAVSESLLGDYLTQGPRVAAFEEALAAAVGARYAVVFNSGTAALHGAYFVAGISGGKAVLTTPITFAATANAALYCGGSVSFADVTLEAALIDPEEVARAQGPVAVLAPVHLAGNVAAMPRLAEIAHARGWVIVEDAAHALGATYNTPVGQELQVGACAHSDMCCFSFHAVKHITTGEGGAVTTNDAKYRRALVRFRSHGITRDRSELEHDEGPWFYEQAELGYNYRITDFQCALGQSQLRRLPQFLARRREIARRYDAAFTGHALVRPLSAPPWSRSAYHLYVVRVPAGARRNLFEDLLAQGIRANVHYIPVYRHPYYRRHGFREVACPVAERYYSEAITLPLYPAMSDADVDRVAEAVTASLAGAEAESRALP